MTENRAKPVSPGNTVVGLVGLGDMGAAMAKSILRHFPLVAFDLRPEPVEKMVALGARRADSLQSVADQCEVVILVVLNDKQVKQVIGDILSHPGKVHTIIVSSTVQADSVITLDEQVRKAGLNLIDAPVNGGAEKASAGTISVLIGGEEAAVQRCWPVFQSFGKNLFHLGPIGAGSAGKLLNTMLAVGNNMLVIEAMQFAEAFGISEDKVEEFISVGTGDSFIMRTWGRFDRMRRTHPTLGGTPAMYELFSKDIKNAVVTAGRRGLVLPIVASISAMVIEKAMARDKYREEHNMNGPAPLCRVCQFELASPFRKAGIHPDCALEEMGHSVRSS